MTSLESRRPRSKLPAVIFILVLLVVGLVAGGYRLAPRFERAAPLLTVTPDSEVLGRASIDIGITDHGAGLKSVSATLTAGGKEHPLAAEVYAHPVQLKTISVALPKLAGVKEGPAVLRVSARDGSLWKFFRGNETVLQKEFTIDLTPPTVALIADDRYVNFGGVGAIVYKPAADTVTSGVKMGDYFFPGFKGQVKDHPDHFIAFFAHPYNVPAEAKAV